MRTSFVAIIREFDPTRYANPIPDDAKNGAVLYFPPLEQKNEEA